MKITSELLHVAADVVGETISPEDLGLTDDALRSFITESTFTPEGGPRGSQEFHPQSLAYGIAVGVAAERQRLATTEEDSA